jgi:hypothetical protein
MRLAVVLALIALALGAGPRQVPGQRDGRGREPSEIAKARLVATSHAGTTHRRVDGSSHGPLALPEPLALAAPAWIPAPPPTAASVRRGDADRVSLRSRSPPSRRSLSHPRLT